MVIKPIINFYKDSNGFPNKRTKSKISKSPKKQMVFVLSSYGEINSLAPLLRSIHKDNKCNFCVLALGDAMVAYRHNSRLSFLKSHLIEFNSKKSSIEDIFHKVENSKLLITGSSSPIQAGLAKLFKNSPNRDTRVIAYIEHYSPNSLELNETVKNADEVITSTKGNADFIHQKLGLTTVALGNPGLEEEILEFKSLKKNDIVNKIQSETNFDPNRKTILFIGSYGNNYKKYLKDFLLQIPTLNNVNILISPHPLMQSSAIEFELVKRLKVGDHVSVLSNVSSAEALSVADVVVHRGSMFAMKSVCVGKPTIFLEDKDGRYSDPTLKAGLSVKANHQNLIQNINKCLKEGEMQNRSNQKNTFALLGIPSNSTESIKHHLYKLIN